MSGFFKKIIRILLVSISLLAFQNYLALGQAISSNVDIVVEPASYVPQFYEGKPLFANQGTARIIAVPNVIVDGKKISSKNLTFKWTRDDVVFLSGAGNDSVTISGNIPIRDINIGVKVMNSSGDILAENSKTISANNPKVLFYENSPLYGVLLHRALVGNYSLGGKEELNVIAKPYFFDVKSQDGSDIDYKWSVNGIPISLSGKKNEILLKQTNTGGAGFANISLDVNNLSRIFQFANASFGINFGQ